MSRCQFIERVIFPELLTHFLKGKYQETYEQVTGRFIESQVNQKQLIGRRYVKTVTYMSCRMEIYMSDELGKIFCSVNQF